MAIAMAGFSHKPHDAALTVRIERDLDPGGATATDQPDKFAIHTETMASNPPRMRHQAGGRPGAAFLG